MENLTAIEHIFIAPRRGAPMQALGAVQAVANLGLAGDRYTRVASRHTDDYQLTLIEAEAIEDFVATTALGLRVDEPRRNLVTRGVRLNDLVGRRFRVGGAVLEGMELCEPCSLFAKRTHREVITRFAGRGGLRARVIEGGEIRVGDAIESHEPIPLSPTVSDRDATRTT